MPRIVVTNDDGIFTRGISVLAERMEELGDVTVVAPDREMSAISHAFTIMRRIHVKEVKENWYAVGGTPADCVYVATHKLAGGPVDLVVSGINRGANLANDIHYSGTVAGAMEGYIHGAHGIAYSQVSTTEGDLERDADMALRIARRVLEQAERQFITVNFPVGEVKGFRMCKLGDRSYKDTLKEKTEDDGSRYFWIEGTADNDTSDDTTDTWAVENGYVSITPLQLDLTDRTRIDRLDVNNL